MMRLYNFNGIGLAFLSILVVTVSSDSVLRFRSHNSLFHENDAVTEPAKEPLTRSGPGKLDLPMHKERSGDLESKSPLKAVVCPDKVSECPDGSTCCVLQDGTYGCCSKAHATCCSDHIHCCGSGCTCDVANATCKCGAPDSLSMPWTTSEPAATGNAVPCPGGEVECSDGQTCCKLSSGVWGCCPFPVAVCCDDNEHCCPQGFTCDVPHQKCNRGDHSIPMLQEQPAQLKTPSNTDCPDGSQCPGAQTCCQDAEGKYLCCPLPEATCCSDQQHCCPQGYTCNLPQQTCDKGPVSVALFAKSPPIAKAKSVICPDRISECSDGSTCCDMGGRYGCCPLLNAVCCSDHIHCCPSGYTCDVSKGSCDAGFLSVPWDTKLPATPRKVADVVCPDQSTCSSDQTCCQLASGDYGCCPESQAVCCSDHLHCCPNGYTCNLVANTCTMGTVSLPWDVKRPAKPAGKVDTVLCPDQTSCQDGETCCLLSSGGYGCCPQPKAVCCSDHLHCCPNGYTCDVASGSCTRGTESVSWQLKRPSAPAGKVESVVCPDQSSCPDGQTCCPLTSGDYGCCPQPKAVCCSDHLHCCPNSYKCNVSVGACTKGIKSMLWDITLRSTPAGLMENVVCPDQSSCPASQTCCPLGSGYGCCPLPQAVCCSDQIHCCPNGYKCDISGSTCNKGTESLPWEVKQPAMRSVP